MDKGSTRRFIKDVMLGRFLLVIVCIMILASGCASGPMTREEMNPVLPSRTADPRVGLVILEGEPACLIEFYDQAGRLIQEWSEAGKDPLTPKFNGHRKPRLYDKVFLEPGYYRLKIHPFYYTSNLFTERRLVELRVRHSSIRVDRKVDSYDSQYTGRYWGWILRINTGDIPRQHYSGPQTNLTGRGLPGWIIDQIFGGGR